MGGSMRCAKVMTYVCVKGKGVLLHCCVTMDSFSMGSVAITQHLL
jgi:hypothetical protein